MKSSKRYGRSRFNIPNWPLRKDSTSPIGRRFSEAAPARHYNRYMFRSGLAVKCPVNDPQRSGTVALPYRYYGRDDLNCKIKVSLKSPPRGDERRNGPLSTSRPVCVLKTSEAYRLMALIRLHHHLLGCRRFPRVPPPPRQKVGHKRTPRRRLLLRPRPHWTRPP
jgi:hypothetical protein